MIVWIAVTGIATAVIACTTVFYWLQLREMNRGRQLESMVTILRYLDDPRLRGARWFMYQHSESINNLLNSDDSFWERRKRVEEMVVRLSEGHVTLAQIEFVINALNNIAFLVKRGLAPPGIVEKYLRPQFLQCWRIMHPYIHYRRQHGLGLPEERSMYGSYFEAVVSDIEAQRAE